MIRKLIVIILILLAGILCFYYLSSKHRNISTENVTAEINAIDFYNDFKKNDTIFNWLYLDKAIILKGKITSSTNTSLTLDFKNFILLKDSIPKSIKKEKNQVAIKGRYVGYDDLLDQLKIDQAILIYKTN